MELIPVCEYNGEAVTTSRAVAEQFGKQHKNVVRDIEEIISQLSPSNFGLAEGEGAENEGSGLNFEPAKSNNTADFAARNFILSEYTDLQGKPRKQYILTRDGFTLLAMGFTGAKAMQFKVAYITAFNRMDQLIRGTGAGMLENAQRAAAQLGAVEGIAGAGKSTASDEVTSQTLGALRAALESGAVSLRRKYKIEDTPENCIGFYDLHFATVYCKELYKAYSKSLTHPLPYGAWHSVLKQSKAIKLSNINGSHGHRSGAFIALSDIGYNPDTPIKRK